MGLSLTTRGNIGRGLGVLMDAALISLLRVSVKTVHCFDCLTICCHSFCDSPSSLLLCLWVVGLLLFPSLFFPLLGDYRYLSITTLAGLFSLYRVASVVTTQSHPVAVDNASPTSRQPFQHQHRVRNAPIVAGLTATRSFLFSP
ncbi:hypothetical protein EX30DRAFT_37422 [Ascodesmis nigricans]|uniref:Uncharacterized protein n=1 Tax=Ascodesmis nigricans TaxID=341454 RepID=A0A4S2MWR8_9PEZI|nr:hypothetical protein EX30DRAFT_37422 [Ascodesmis nigricans]